MTGTVLGVTLSALPAASEHLCFHLRGSRPPSRHSAYFVATERLLGRIHGKNIMDQTGSCENRKFLPSCRYFYAADVSMVQILEVLCGLQYLHGMDVVHGKLAVVCLYFVGRSATESNIRTDRRISSSLSPELSF